jgi:lipid-binding SYLF domain-containing protein
MKITFLSSVASVALCAAFASTVSVADTAPEIDVGVHETLKQFDALNPHHKHILQSAAGALIFPRITKAGAGIGGEYGEGVLRVSGKTVGYYSVSSASIGLTLGAAKRREIIVFTTQEALDKFVASKGWSVGADAGVAVMSKGAGADYDTETLQKPIVGFVFGEKGLIGDLSLDGSKINKLDK